MPFDDPRPRDDDDDEELSIRKRDAGRGRWPTWLALAAVGIVLTTCLTGGVIVILRSASSDALAEKLAGSWKGEFVFPGQPPIDAVYIFERNGEFRQETLDKRGQIKEVFTGRWRVVLGEIVIGWDNGVVEHATVTWTDDQTMKYKIIDHDEAIQIGSITTMRRYQPLPQRKGQKP